MVWVVVAIAINAWNYGSQDVNEQKFIDACVKEGSCKMVAKGEGAQRYYEVEFKNENEKQN